MLGSFGDLRFRFMFTPGGGLWICSCGKDYSKITGVASPSGEASCCSQELMSDT